MSGLKLDERSLEFILNFTLENLKEDRKLALGHHDTLASLLTGASGEADSDLEIQMAVQELSAALVNFLRSASTSTEQGIKLAKILSDILANQEEGGGFSDEERQDMIDMARDMEDEKNKIDRDANILELNAAIKG